jgi:hypothetical protein
MRGKVLLKLKPTNPIDDAHQFTETAKRQMGLCITK